jgi:hypothetical protein
MRMLAVTGLLVVLLLVPAAAAKTSTRVEAGHGISFVLPAGWRLAHREYSHCADPVQRLAVTSDHATVLLQETNFGRFPARPARFRLPQAVGNIGGCCGMASGAGAELLFRDHGRRFYAFVYGSRDRAGVLALLNSLKVSPGY